MRFIIVQFGRPAIRSSGLDEPFRWQFVGRLGTFQCPRVLGRDGRRIDLQNNEQQKGDILHTRESFKDFVCELDFKFISGRIDSGVHVRNDKDQIQIGESGSLKRDMTASPYIPGKGYPVEAEGVKDLLKMKDWNTLRIRCVGPKYTTWLTARKS